LKKAGGEEALTIAPKVCTDTIESLPVCDIIILSVKSQQQIQRMFMTDC